MVYCEGCPSKAAEAKKTLDFCARSFRFETRPQSESCRGFNP